MFLPISYVFSTSLHWSGVQQPSGWTSKSPRKSEDSPAMAQSGSGGDAKEPGQKNKEERSIKDHIWKHK